MASWKQWDDEIEEMDTGELTRYATALETVEEWGFFKKEYEWTGLFTIKAMVRREIERRGDNDFPKR